jgi:hypothetical protein
MFLRYFSRLSFTVTSRTLERAGRIATDWYEHGEDLDFPPFLYTGCTIAVLNPSGTIPDASDGFTKCAIGLARVAMPFFRIDTGMPSVPIAKFHDNGGDPARAGKRMAVLGRLSRPGRRTGWRCRCELVPDHINLVDVVRIQRICGIQQAHHCLAAIRSCH